MTEPDRLENFWADLKRRRIFRTGAVYVVATWAVVQAASIAFPAFGVADWVMRALLVGVFAGFPIVVVLAWILDFTPRGIQVTAPRSGKYPGGVRPPRWWVRPLVGAPLIAAVLGTTVWLWTAHVAGTGESEFTQQRPSGAPPVVAVFPLENLTGNRELDWAGAGIATLVRDDLAQSRHLAVVSAARTVRLLGQDAGELHTSLRRAADAGVTHVLTGEVLSTPKGLTIATRLTDLGRSIELTASRQQGLQADAILGVATSLAAMVKQSLGLPGTEKVDVFAADFASRNLAAYESFIAGMEYFLRFNYQEARHGFEVAVEKAPDFAMARYRLAHTLAMLGDTQGALAQVQVAQRDSARLSPLEQGYIAAGGHYFARRYREAERHYRRILERYPYETEARLLLIYVLLDLGEFEEGLANARALAAQEPDSEVAWGVVADLSLKLQRFDGADEALQRYLALAPDNPNAHVLMGDALFLRRRYREARPHYEEALRLDPGFAAAPLQLAYAAALSGVWADALQRFTAIANAETFSDSDRITAAFEWASLLRANGRCEEATSVLEGFGPAIARERIRQALAIAFRGYCALDLGQVEAARQIAGQAVAASPGRATRYLYLRTLAEIAAGDLDAAQATIREVARTQEPLDAADQTTRKAAEHLSGLVALARDDAAGAVQPMQQAQERPGKEYDVYQLGLATALLAAGDRPGAAKAATLAAAPPEPGDPRLDLELSRRRATLLRARLLEESGDPGKASALAGALSRMWADADPGFGPRAELLAWRGHR